jgi:hypothetical protein
MWSIWDAPSDRDYREQFGEVPDEDDPAIQSRATQQVSTPRRTGKSKK